MRWVERFDLFLLDLDGLLVDTEALHYEAYCILCRRYGYTLPWDKKKYFDIAHSSASGLQQAIHPHLEKKELNWQVLYQEKKEIYLKLLQTKGASLLPGVESFLQYLMQNRIKRGVVTHSCRKHVEVIKHFLPILQTIPVWITREEYASPKPAPDGYLKGLELLFEPQDRVIGFEDSLRGIQSLQRATIFPVLICDPLHPQLQEKKMAEVVHYPSFAHIPHSFSGKAL